MNHCPKQISLQEWDQRYQELVAAGLRQPAYGGPLRRHVEHGDYRLLHLRFDDSPAALRLWNFLLSETDRLFSARRQGKPIIGVMKDLGTVPVMVYSLPDAVAFYPDGTWWVPCVMEQSTCDLTLAQRLGIDETFCPVRAMLGAFQSGLHFPRPDLLISSVGATCDDFSAIAQRLESLGWPILWWEIPHRRKPEADEAPVRLPGLFLAPVEQVAFVRGELDRIRTAISGATARAITDEMLVDGIRMANRVRRILAELRRRVFTAPRCPLPALEMLIAEMLAIHYCSDRGETLQVLGALLDEVTERIVTRQGLLEESAPKVFWVNPVADLRAMNLLEECGGRLCGTEFLFCHALDEIPEDLQPMEALARMALADPMAGPAADRVERIAHDARFFGAEAILVSRIPGASHCGLEGQAIRKRMEREGGLPVIEIEVPPLSDAIGPTLRTRMEALVETVRQRRKLRSNKDLSQ